MRNVKEKRISLEELHGLMGRELPHELWKLLIGRLRLPEVELEGALLRFPEYVPLRELLAEGLRQLDQGEIVPRTCESCGEWFDINVAEGIFGDAESFEVFLCGGCARRLDAWTFYWEYLRR